MWCAKYGGSIVVLCVLLRIMVILFMIVFFQAEDGIRDLVRSRGLGDVYKRQGSDMCARDDKPEFTQFARGIGT